MNKFARGLCSTLLKLSLFSLALMGAAVLVFGTPESLKESLAESKLYDTFVDGVLQSSIDASENQEQGLSFPLSDPEIQSIAKQAFHPDLLRQSTEQIIDGTYAWLDGETAQPEFNVDLGQAKQTFANGVGDYSVRRFNSLPRCTLRQLQTLEPSINAFSVPCQPPGVSAAMLRSQVISEIMLSKEFLPETVITPETPPKDQSGKTFAEQVANAPGTAQILKQLPWILASVSLLAAAAIVYLHEQRTSGVRSVAATFTGTGIFLLVGTLLLGFIFAQMNRPGGNVDQLAEGQFQQAIVSVFRSLSIEFNSRLVIFSLAYIAVGVLLYGILRVMHSNDVTATEISTTPQQNSVPIPTEAPVIEQPQVDNEAKQ